jgi:hypothetical protein
MIRYGKEVPGAHGVGRVKLIYKLKKTTPFWKRRISILLYCSMFFTLFISWSWSRLSVKYQITIPILQNIFSIINLFSYTVPRLGRVYPTNTITKIEVSDDDELLYQQGYLHARDHLLQMEIYRRLAKGNLSSIFGPKTENWDLIVKSLDLYGLATSEWDNYSRLKDKKVYQSLLTYCRGVNSAINQEFPEFLPFEFLYSFGFTFARKSNLLTTWEPIDSLAILRLLMYLHGSGWEDEIILKLIQLNLYDIVSISSWSLLQTKLLQAKANLFQSSLSSSNRLIQSENIIGGSILAIPSTFSVSNQSILAINYDSYEKYQGYWIPMELQSSQQHLKGISFPSIPWLFAGTNGVTAFAFLHRTRTTTNPTNTTTTNTSLLQFDTVTDLSITQQCNEINNDNNNNNKRIINIISLLSKDVQDYFKSQNIHQILYTNDSLLEYSQWYQWLTQLNTMSTLSDIQRIQEITADTIDLVITHKNDQQIYHTHASDHTNNNNNTILALSSLPRLVSLEHQLDSLSSSSSSSSSDKKLSRQQVDLLQQSVYSHSGKLLAHELVTILKRHAQVHPQQEQQEKQQLEQFISLLETFSGDYSSSSILPSILEAFRIYYYRKLMTMWNVELSSRLLGLRSIDNQYPSHSMKRFSEMDFRWIIEDILQHINNLALNEPSTPILTQNHDTDNVIDNRRYRKNYNHQECSVFHSIASNNNDNNNNNNTTKLICSQDIYETQVIDSLFESFHFLCDVVYCATAKQQQQGNSKWHLLSKLMQNSHLQWQFIHSIMITPIGAPVSFHH